MIAEFRPRDGASKRTKNRLREHGGQFQIMTVNERLTIFGNRPGILLACQCHEDAWVGWLPCHEVIQERTVA